MRVADYVASALAAHGIRDVFLVTGGGAMHLNDAIGRCPELRYVACHHEQTCAMAHERGLNAQVDGAASARIARRARSLGSGAVAASV